MGMALSPTLMLSWWPALLLPGEARKEAKGSTHPFPFLPALKQHLHLYGHPLQLHAIPAPPHPTGEASFYGGHSHLFNQRKWTELLEK